ncbi:MBL fold metallo-hydrolase [Enterococcus sp. 669A]|uniref:MBL fold metallo-hydrolase n=1 Tax=Candidatus Enterococcus moelleringii TaxID=2815325 RepID=A0ABS3LC62_9ENTE|nr:MBL fold metallo-hydrolase [Enterococcus sp. 669A]MBO1307214.1 MBL fold metallo-hydrolase [Enterococcus sp. 669A]
MKKQATPPTTIPFGKEAFEPIETTEIRWLGNSGILMNSRGYCMMADPVLEGFDLPLLIDLPIPADEVPHLDNLLITHSDNDHYSLDTLKKILPVTKTAHAPIFVADLMKETFDYPATGHAIHETFQDGDITVTLTPADHLWQNARSKPDRVYKMEDYCGFWIETPDGTLWIPGDSKLLPEQLEMPQPDAILYDFSDNEWHIGLDNAILLANTYPKADLLLSHWGTVDAPDKDVFNGDPEDLYDKVVNPERIRVLAAGEPFRLNKH